MIKKSYKGFTLSELLVATLVVSIMLIAMAPVMTKKAKNHMQERVAVQQPQTESVPIGTIVLWYGTNVPDGWIECSGQDTNVQELQDIKNAVPNSNNLPNLNAITNNIDTNIKWIIKVKK